MSEAGATSESDDKEASGARQRLPDVGDPAAAMAELKRIESTLRTRAEVLERAMASDRDLLPQAGLAYCALGRFYADSLRNPRSAIEAYRRASEIDPQSVEAIRGARVLYTKARRYQKALRMLAAEQARVEDVVERTQLHRNEAVLRRKLGDLAGASQALRLALRRAPEDSTLIEDLARSILQRVRAGHDVEDAEREEAASLFGALARSLWPKPHAAPGLEPSSPEASATAIETTPPPRRRSRRQERPTQPSPAMAAPAAEQVHDGWTQPAPQPPGSSLPIDWSGPDSDWPRQSLDSLDAADHAAIAELQAPGASAAPADREPRRSSAPPAALQHRGSTLPAAAVTGTELGIDPGMPGSSSEPVPRSSLLLPPPADVESVTVFELRSPTGRPPPPSARPPAMEPAGLVKAGLEPTAAPRTIESQRPQGDALIGRLFEALHTLEFLNDAQAGAEFVLRLVMDGLQVEIGIVHLYDINTRTFVIASAGGPKADLLIELRSPETEPLLAEAMACGQPLLLAEAEGHPLTSSGRWALLDCARSILCAPARQEGRFLGAIEVANPVDGSPFSVDDLNAMSYVAERFARFLGERGIVLSGDDVSAAE